MAQDPRSGRGSRRTQVLALVDRGSCGTGVFPPSFPGVRPPGRAARLHAATARERNPRRSRFGPAHSSFEGACDAPATRRPRSALVVPGLEPVPRRGALRARAGGGTASAAVEPGEECPPGTTRDARRAAAGPGFPPPSIVDYRPRSTLVTEDHLVPKAKFPVVDVHGHPRRRLESAGGLVERVVAELDSMNVGVMSRPTTSRAIGWHERWTRSRPVPTSDRFRVLAGINFPNVGPGWAERAVAQLEADVKAGAVGIGEISKAFGLTTRKADGTRLRVDDPELDPVWAGVRAAQHPRLHPHGRTAGILPAARHAQRALARAGALPRPPELRARAGPRSSS